MQRYVSIKNIKDSALVKKINDSILIGNLGEFLYEHFFISDNGLRSKLLEIIDSKFKNVASEITDRNDTVIIKVEFSELSMLYDNLVNNFTLMLIMLEYSMESTKSMESIESDFIYTEKEQLFDDKDSKSYINFHLVKIWNGNYKVAKAELEDDILLKLQAKFLKFIPFIVSFFNFNNVLHETSFKPEHDNSYTLNNVRLQCGVSIKVIDQPYVEDFLSILKEKILAFIPFICLFYDSKCLEHDIGDEFFVDVSDKLPKQKELYDAIYKLCKTFKFLNLVDELVETRKNHNMFKDFHLANQLDKLLLFNAAPELFELLKDKLFLEKMFLEKNVSSSKLTDGKKSTDNDRLFETINNDRLFETINIYNKELLQLIEKLDNIWQFLKLHDDEKSFCNTNKMLFIVHLMITQSKFKPFNYELCKSLKKTSEQLNQYQNSKDKSVKPISQEQIGTLYDLGRIFNSASLHKEKFLDSLDIEKCLLYVCNTKEPSLEPSLNREFIILGKGRNDNHFDLIERLCYLILKSKLEQLIVRNLFEFLDSENVLYQSLGIKDKYLEILNELIKLMLSSLNNKSDSCKTIAELKTHIPKIGVSTMETLEIKIDKKSKLKPSNELKKLNKCSECLKILYDLSKLMLLFLNDKNEKPCKNLKEDNKANILSSTLHIETKIDVITTLENLSKFLESLNTENKKILQDFCNLSSSETNNKSSEQDPTVVEYLEYLKNLDELKSKIYVNINETSTNLYSVSIEISSQVKNISSQVKNEYSTT